MKSHKDHIGLFTDLHHVRAKEMLVAIRTQRLHGCQIRTVFFDGLDALRPVSGIRKNIVCISFKSQIYIQQYHLMSALLQRLIDPGSRDQGYLAFCAGTTCQYYDLHRFILPFLHISCYGKPIFSLPHFSRQRK